jgi:hypothetical protein
VGEQGGRDAFRDAFLALDRGGGIAGPAEWRRPEEDEFLDADLAERLNEIPEERRGSERVRGRLLRQHRAADAERVPTDLVAELIEQVVLIAHDGHTLLDGYGLQGAEVGMDEGVPGIGVLGDKPEADRSV